MPVAIALRAVAADRKRATGDACALVTGINRTTTLLVRVGVYAERKLA